MLSIYEFVTDVYGNYPLIDKYMSYGGKLILLKIQLDEKEKNNVDYYY